MQSIPLPQKFTEEKVSKNKSIFSIEPLYPGYGRTVGNALRRVLLSSLRGEAITSIKIEGVEHEFSTIPHVKEDVVDIILNIKQVYLKSSPELFNNEDVPILELNAEGSKTVTAGDFETHSGIEILNPKQVLATLTDDTAKLSIKAAIGQGRGYDPIEGRQDVNKEIGRIAIDALYTPVLEVGYEVENTRVGQMTNWDSLKITIETKGTISPKEALEQASEILVNHFQIVKDFPEEGHMKDSEETENEESDVEEKLSEEEEKVEENDKSDK